MSQVPAVANALPGLETGISSAKQSVKGDAGSAAGFGEVLEEVSVAGAEPAPSSAMPPDVEVEAGGPGEVALADANGETPPVPGEPLPPGGNASPLPQATLPELASTQIPDSDPVTGAVAGLSVDRSGQPIGTPVDAQLGRNVATQLPRVGETQGTDSALAPLRPTGPIGSVGEPLTETSVPPMMRAVLNGAASTPPADASLAPAKPSGALAAGNFSELQRNAIEAFRPAEGVTLDDAFSGRAVERLTDPTSAMTNAQASNVNATPSSNVSATAGLGFTPALNPTDNLSSRPFQGALAANVGTPEFTQEVSHRIAWLARQDGGVARLELSPPELGPINVKVTVQGEQAQIVMNAQHALTRDALEDSAERLKEALAEEGFAQVDVDVGSREHSEEEGQSERGGSSASASSDDLARSDVPVQVRVSSHPGLVDRYA